MLHLRNFSRGGIDNFLGESLTSLIRCSLASLHQLAYLRNVFQFGHSATLPPIKTTKMSLFSRNCVIHQLNHSFGEGILKIQIQIHKSANTNSQKHKYKTQIWIQIHKYRNCVIHPFIHSSGVLEFPGSFPGIPSKLLPRPQYGLWLASNTQASFKMSSNQKSWYSRTGRLIRVKVRVHWLWNWVDRNKKLEWSETCWKHLWQMATDI